MLVIPVQSSVEVFKLTTFLKQLESEKIEYSLVYFHELGSYGEAEDTFKELDLQPQFQIELSKRAITQLETAITNFTRVLNSLDAKAMVILGNTVSHLAAALTALKFSIPIIRLDAGLRNFNQTEQDEINRKIIDTISNILFVPSVKAATNLYYEGKDPSRVFISGSLLVDAVKEHKNVISSHSQKILDFISKREEKTNDFVLVILDGEVTIQHKALKEVINGIKSSITPSDKIIVVFEASHKGVLTASEIIKGKEVADPFILIPKTNYLDILGMIACNSCKIVVTFSDKWQEEALILEKPCITVKTTTLYAETVEWTVNFLVKPNADEIHRTIKEIQQTNFLKRFFEYTRKIYVINNVSEKIVTTIRENIDNLNFVAPDHTIHGPRTFLLIYVKSPMTKKEIEERYNCRITLVYDDAGAPIPIPELLQPGYRVRVILE